MRRESKNIRTKEIRVVGLGGVGCDALNWLISAGHQSLQFIALDTDDQTLENSKASVRIPIGSQLAQHLEEQERALAAAAAVFEAKQEIHNALKGARMLFIIAGLGGGTGSSTAPVIAKIAKNLGIFTVAVVTGPERSAGYSPTLIAKKAIKELEKCVDNLMVLPTDHLMILSRKQIALSETLQTFSKLLCQSVQVVNEFVSHNGLINLDLSNLKNIMSNKGATLITTGRAQGKDRAQMAAERALFCPNLGLSIHGARGILINIKASGSLNLSEAQTITDIIKSSTYMGAEIVLGIDIDETLGDIIWISVIATGFFNENWEIGTNYEQSLPPEKQPVFVPPKNSEETGSTVFKSPKEKRVPVLSLSNLPVPAFLRS